MNYATAGEQHNILVEFLVDGVPVIPDTINYWLFDNASSIVDNLDDITVSPEGEAVIITIPDTANIRTKPIEYRKLYLEFTVNGMTYNVVKHYFLKDAIFFPLSAEDVRAVIGVGNEELPDDMIDITTAYESVKTDTNGLDLDTIMENGAAEAEYIIKAVSFKAALNCVYYLNTTVMKIEQADNTMYERFNGFDFKGTLNRLSSNYSKYINLLIGKQTGTTLTYSLISTGTDVITGQ